MTTTTTPRQETFGELPWWHFVRGDGRSVRDSRRHAAVHGSARKTHFSPLGSQVEDRYRNGTGGAQPEISGWLIRIVDAGPERYDVRQEIWFENRIPETPTSKQTCFQKQIQKCVTTKDAGTESKFGIDLGSPLK